MTGRSCDEGARARARVLGMLIDVKPNEGIHIMLYARYRHILVTSAADRPFDDVRYRCPNCFAARFLSIAKPGTRVRASPTRKTHVSYNTLHTRCIYFIFEHVRGIQSGFFRYDFSTHVKNIKKSSKFNINLMKKNSLSNPLSIFSNLHSKCFCTMNLINNLIGAKSPADFIECLKNPCKINKSFENVKF